MGLKNATRDQIDFCGVLPLMHYNHIVVEVQGQNITIMTCWLVVWN